MPGISEEAMRTLVGTLNFLAALRAPPARFCCQWSQVYIPRPAIHPNAESPTVLEGKYEESISQSRLQNNLRSLLYQRMALKCLWLGGKDRGSEHGEGRFPEISHPTDVLRASACERFGAPLHFTEGKISVYFCTGPWLQKRRVF